MNDKCPICLEELRTKLGVIPSCGHCLHESCWEELKQNATQNDSTNVVSSSTLKHPRCPVCKHKAKRFVKMYLELSSPQQIVSSSTSTLASSTSMSSSTSMHVESEADEAVRCLSSENFKLKQKMRELESVSKDQSELLLEVLPKYDALEHEVKLHNIEKAYLESKLEGIEAENAELISDWNLVEIKMQNLEGENQALKEENGILKSARDILAKRLVKITMRNITSSKDGDNIDGSTSNKSMKRRKVMDDMHSDANRTPQNLLNTSTNHPNKKTVVLKRRKKRTRESIAREYEMEKRKLKHMLAEATNETDKLKKRVEKLKKRANKERRTRGLSI